MRPLIHVKRSYSSSLFDDDLLSLNLRSFDGTGPFLFLSFSTTWAAGLPQFIFHPSVRNSPGCRPAFGSRVISVHSL